MGQRKLLPRPEMDRLQSPALLIWGGLSFADPIPRDYRDPRIGQSPTPIPSWSWNSAGRGRGDGPGHWAVKRGGHRLLCAGLKTISRPDTAVLPHSQLTAWVFPGKTYVPGTARREVYPGEQSPSLWLRRGRGHPLWGLCLRGWETKLEMGTKTGKPTSIASALCTRYPQP